MCLIILMNGFSAFIMLGATFIMWGNYGSEWAYPYIIFGWLAYILLTNLIFGLFIKKINLASYILVGVQVVAALTFATLAVQYFD